MPHPAVDPRMARAAAVIAHATEALDGQANALAWLEGPNPYLGNKTPLQVMDTGTQEDVNVIDKLLSAVENGIHV